eukprot:10971777-Ditylum_brightwellii.AAC.1
MHAAFSSLSLQLSSSPIPAKHFYKPGGTLCITQGDINSQKVDQGAGKYSRWSYVKFAAQNAIVTTVITAYKPCVVTKQQAPQHIINN